MKVTAAMLRLRFDDARRQAVKEALECQDTTLAESVRQFQFRDIRPKAASEIDDLGDASRLEVKFRNLRWFYREALNKKGWGEYKTINLKYHDQVVAAH